MAEHTPTQPCVVCQTHIPERGMVCEGDRVRIAQTLDEIVEQCDLLAGPPPTRPALDPVSARLPAAAIPGPARGRRVSGSRSPRVPGNLSAMDLLGPSNPKPSVTGRLVPLVRIVTEVTEVELDSGDKRKVTRWSRETVHDASNRVVMVPDGDQHGRVSVAAVLDSWAREWQEVRAMAETLPKPSVEELARWLSNRLDWAYEHHAAIDDFADEIRSLLLALKRARGDVVALPEHMKVPCRECDRVELYRHPGDDRVRCNNEDCRLILTDAEFHRWVGLCSARVHLVRPRTWVKLIDADAEVWHDGKATLAVCVYTGELLVDVDASEDLRVLLRPPGDVWTDGWVPELTGAFDLAERPPTPAEVPSDEAA